MREKTTDKQSLDEILDGFSVTEREPGISPSSGAKSVTIWVRAEDKARYDRLQAVSGKRFGKTVREVFLAALALAERRAS